MGLGLAKAGMILTIIGLLFLPVLFIGYLLISSSAADNAIFAILLVINIIVLGLIIHGYRRVKKIQRGRIPLTKGYLYFVGILSLFITVIGGILIIFSVAQAEDTRTSKNKYEQYRQGDYVGYGKYEDYRALQRKRSNSYQNNYSSKHDDY